MSNSLGITSILNATFFAQLMSFFIFLAVLHRTLWPLAIQKLDERQALLKQGVMDAQEASERLRCAKEKSARELRLATESAEGIKKSAKKEREILRKQTELEIEDRKKSARDEVLQSSKALKAQIFASLEAELSDFIVEAASKLDAPIKEAWRGVSEGGLTKDLSQLKALTRDKTKGGASS